MKIIIFSVQGSAEKFIAWPKYSHGIWPNKLYFSTWIHLQFTHFHWSKKSSIADVTFFSAHPCMWKVINNISNYQCFVNVKLFIWPCVHVCHYIFNPPIRFVISFFYFYLFIYLLLLFRIFPLSILLPCFIYQKETLKGLALSVCIQMNVASCLFKECKLSWDIRNWNH